MSRSRVATKRKHEGSLVAFRVTLVSQQDFLEKTSEKYGMTFTDKIENTMVKPPRSKKKSK